MAKTIAMLTDFGTADHFVGVMKGVIAGIAPAARVVDISHDVTPYSIRQARFLLSRSWPWFPEGTVFLCVVDPGVGSTRRPIVVHSDHKVFVGPDNGLFSELIRRRGAEVREITNRRLFAGDPSATFHGRDIFAPVAARLARGIPISRVGARIADALVESSDQMLRTGRRFWQGEVVHVDRFGNLITNLSAAEFPNLSSRPFQLKVGLRAIERVCSCYDQGPAGEPLLIVGSHGFLEVAVRQDSAARHLGVAVGSPVEMEMP